MHGSQPPGRRVRAQGDRVPGVSTFQTDALPPELEERLPSVPELTEGLQRIVEERADEVDAVLQGVDD